MPRGVYKRTEEQKDRIRELSQKYGFQKGCITWNKGKTDIYSKDTLKQMSEIKKGKPIWNKGLKTGLIPKSAFKKGHKPVHTLLGKHLSMEHKRKISEANKGEKSKSWKGGITPLNRAIRNSLEYQQWRSDVYKRDYWTCQTCNKKGGKIKLHAHHIKPFTQILQDNNITDVIEAQFCEELWDIDNGITLCWDCHKLAHKEDKNER